MAQQDGSSFDFKMILAPWQVGTWVDEQRFGDAAAKRIAIEGIGRVLPVGANGEARRRRPGKISAVIDMLITGVPNGHHRIEIE
jgi:hypothetical protein